MHYDESPALTPVTSTRRELLRHLETAVERVIELGVNGLTLKLLLVDAGV